MADYSQRDLAAARRVIRGLYKGEVSNLDIGEGVSIADIENDTAKFIEDLTFLEEIGADVPAIRIEGDQREMVPIDLQHYLSLNNLRGPWPWRARRREYFREDWYYWNDEVRHAISQGEATLPRKEARSTYDRLAGNFLANRIAGSRDLRKAGSSLLSLFQKKKGSMIPVPGCTFSVTTNTSGLRVLWSGGYIISPKFFAAPTSPVSSTLQSGTYVFGVDGGAYGSTPQWDTTGLVTLPGNPTIHLNF